MDAEENLRRQARCCQILLPIFALHKDTTQMSLAHTEVVKVWASELAKLSQAYAELIKKGEA